MKVAAFLGRFLPHIDRLLAADTARDEEWRVQGQTVLHLT